MSLMSGENGLGCGTGGAVVAVACCIQPTPTQLSYTQFIRTARRDETVLLRWVRRSAV